MSKSEYMGLRVLTDAEMGFLRSTRNYGGAVVMAFLKMNKDAAALDLADAGEAELTMKRTRRAITVAGLNRYLQVYVQGKVLIISQPPGAEALELTDEQKEALQ